MRLSDRRLVPDGLHQTLFARLPDSRRPERFFFEVIIGGRIDASEGLDDPGQFFGFAFPVKVEGHGVAVEHAVGPQRQ